ncbi:MAG: hypothetical protein LCH85_02130 [Chloroflexi bacterium]|nr:hypothetical protein [Chloroflexota bacterium]
MKPFIKPLREHTIPEIIGGGGVILGIGVVLLCIVFGVDINTWRIQWQPRPLYPHRIGQVTLIDTSKQHQAIFTSASDIYETFAWYDRTLAEQLFHKNINIDTPAIQEKTYYMCTGMKITVRGEAATNTFTITMRKGFPMRSPPSCSELIFKNQSIPVYLHHESPIVAQGVDTIMFTSSRSITETLEWYDQTLKSQAFQIDTNTKNLAHTQITYHLCNGINITIIAKIKTNLFQVSKHQALSDHNQSACNSRQ